DVWPVRGHGPRLDVAREVVGGRLVDARMGSIAVDRRDPRCGRETGDLGRDRRGRVAGLLLPALDAIRRAVGDEEVRRWDHVLGVEARVTRETRLPVHQDRIRGLVELYPAGVGRRL